jgi:hypothetical protein
MAIDNEVSGEGWKAIVFSFPNLVLIRLSEFQGEPLPGWIVLFYFLERVVHI